MARIKITDDRFGQTFRFGLNGRFYEYPVGQEREVDDLLVEHLKSQGVALDECEQSGRASSSEEGSEGGLALTGPNAVRAPAMDAKSLDDRALAGDQPGDVTAAGGGFGEDNEEGDALTLEERTRISDIRVAAERRTQADVSPAELAGEGELGTEATEPPSDPVPSDSKSNKKSSKKNSKK